jgi:hypothetical protein
MKKQENLFNLNDLITTKQVAKMLGCTVRNVALLVKDSKIKPILVLDNKHFLFDINQIKKINYVKRSRSTFKQK